MEQLARRGAGQAKPIDKADLAKRCVVAGEEGARDQRSPEVTRARIGDDLTRIASHAELPATRSSRRNCSGPATSTIPFTGGIDRAAGSCRPIRRNNRSSAADHRTDESPPFSWSLTMDTSMQGEQAPDFELVAADGSAPPNRS